MDKKITQAQEILEALGLPTAQQNKISALTLLALGEITPSTPWKNATAKSHTLSKDIIEFVNQNYQADYKPNTRESFRKTALKPFIDNNIVILNPDDPKLKPTSSKTHYSLTPLVIKTIREYDTENWEGAVGNFRKEQFSQNKPSPIILRNITINNFKSISEDTIELGRFNVFIGTNGSGKSNILEAIATAGSSIANDLNFEGLYSRGVRIARPDLTISSFLSVSKKKTIDFQLQFETETGIEGSEISLQPEDPADIYTEWKDIKSPNNNWNLKQLLEEYNRIQREKSNKGINSDKIVEEIFERLGPKGVKKDQAFSTFLTEFSIFDLNTKSLRGITPADSRKTPLGINGEGLDLLISTFNSLEKNYLQECSSFFDWLESIKNQKDDNESKANSLKPGRSSSTLYFTDKYMQKQNNTFSAENSNEGILHILFYLSLFISNKTPKFFAIDNIETALNPRLCQKLITMLTSLAKERGKQAIVTTHNPAILDGLNLFDDEQRLFEVFRDSEGKTKTRRIKFKKNLEDKKFKLSEMWLKGLLGAVPQNF